MKYNRAWLFAGVFALTACEQVEQTLPFDIGSDPVSRVIPAEGGIISTSQGASVAFPAGSIPAGTEVTLTPQAQPSSTQSGIPSGTASFHLAPRGVRLAQPATVTLKLGGRPEDAWLASVLNDTPSGHSEVGAANVDLSAGLVRAKVSELGTLTAIVPEPEAVIQVGALEDVPAASTSAVSGTSVFSTRRLAGDCGDVGNRCHIRVQASKTLRDLVSGIAVIFPRIKGALEISSGTAQGTVTLSGTVKTRLGRIGNGEAISVSIEATPQTVATETTNEIVLQNVIIRGSGMGMNGEESITIRIQHNGGSTAWISVTRNDVSYGNEAHSFRIEFPLIRS